MNPNNFATDGSFDPPAIGVWHPFYALDPSQGINNGSLVLINYVDPIVSILLLVGLSILLLLIGIIRFKKREITN